jgi:hypothetical protein
MVCIKFDNNWFFDLNLREEKTTQFGVSVVLFTKHQKEYIKEVAMGRACSTCERSE